MTLTDMKNLKVLQKELKTLAKAIKTEIPKETSSKWLSTTQNAFLLEADPLTGRKWSDRHGLVFGKGLYKAGNVEPYLNYKKLQRTGRLLKGIKVRVRRSDNATVVEMYNRVPYAEDHETGTLSGDVRKIPKQYLRNGASKVITGGAVTARPHMRPSKNILLTPKNMLVLKMRKNGW